MYRSLTGNVKDSMVFGFAILLFLACPELARQSE
jgi:hypothetical protein